MHKRRSSRRNTTVAEAPEHMDAATADAASSHTSVAEVASDNEDDIADDDDSSSDDDVAAGDAGIEVVDDDDDHRHKRAEALIRKRRRLSGFQVEDSRDPKMSFAPPLFVQTLEKSKTTTTSPQVTTADEYSDDDDAAAAAADFDSAGDAGITTSLERQRQRQRGGGGGGGGIGRGILPTGVSTSSANFFVRNFPLNKPDDGHWSEIRTFTCMHDWHEYTGYVVSMPLKFSDLYENYQVFGQFCSLSCMLAYVNGDAEFVHQRDDIATLAQQMAIEVYDVYEPIAPAPNRNTLAKIMGPGGLTIEEFRSVGQRSLRVDLKPAPFFAAPYLMVQRPEPGHAGYKRYREIEAPYHAQQTTPWHFQRFDAAAAAQSTAAAAAAATSAR